MTDEEFFALLVCPDDKAKVERRGDFLVCTQCGRRYPIRDGLPIMLIDEALPPEPAGSTAE